MRSFGFQLAIIFLFLSILCFSADVAYPSDGGDPGGGSVKEMPRVNGIRAEDVRSNETGWIRISWQPIDIPDLDHYLIYRSEMGSGWGKYDLKVIGWTGETSFVDKSSSNGTEYFYGVTAVDREGNEGELGELVGPVSPRDDVPPRVDPISLVPASGDSAVSISSPLEFTISDGGYGVDIRSVSVKVEGRSYGEGTKGFYYDGDISSYRIKVVPGFLFENGDTVVVEISAKDLSPNANAAKPFIYRFVTENWSFASFETFDVGPGGGVELSYEDLSIQVPPDTSLGGFKLKAGIARTSIDLPQGAVGLGNIYGLQILDLEPPPAFPAKLSFLKMVPDTIPDDRVFLLFLPSEGGGWRRLEDALISDEYAEFQFSEDGALRVCYYDEEDSPYIAECSPEAGEDEIPLDADLRIDIVDDGAGVDLSSIELRLTVNGRELSPDIYLSGNSSLCEVSCPLSELGLSHGDTVHVHVVAKDLSLKVNVLEDEYYFVLEPDRSPPVIEIVDPGEALYGEDFNVIAKVEDEAPLEGISAELFYRRGGEREFHEIPMSVRDDGTFGGNIPGSFVTLRGVEFYIKASDGRNESIYPEGYPDARPVAVPVRISEAELRRKLSEIVDNRPTGLISLPLELLWSGSPPEKTEAVAAGPGTGLRVEDLRAEAITCPGRSVKTDRDYRIVLSPGWNAVGCPFAFPVSWADVLSESGYPDVETPWRFDGNGYRRTYLLVPWEGYWVRNPSDGEVTLEIPPVEASDEARGKSSPYVWRLRISASSSGLSDPDNFVGVAEGASVIRDRWDFAEPPVPEGPHLSLYLPHSDWEIDPGNYAGDFHPPAEGHDWRLELNYKLERASDITLELSGLESIPDGFVVSLFNVDELEPLHIDERGMAVLRPASSEGIVRLSLVVGTEGYSDNVKAAMGDSLGVGGKLMAFPNPFNTSTLVRFYVPRNGTEGKLVHCQLIIYNMLGQEVRKLVDEPKAPGAYSVGWDGKDAEGRSVGTGVYFLRLRAGNFEAIERVVLIR